MHVPLTGHQQQLGLGEARVDQRQRNGVESEVPRREPGIFPGIRHREHLGGIQLAPVRVAPGLALLGWDRLPWIPVQPLRYVEVVVLLAPDQAGERLALDQASVFAEARCGGRGIERICLCHALRNDAVHLLDRCGRVLRQPRADDPYSAGRQVEDVLRASLGGRVVGRRQAAAIAGDDGRVEGILDVPAA